MVKKISEKSLKSLERLENNYRMIYIIIMSAPLILAMEILVTQQNAITGVLQFKDFSLVNWTDVVMFFVFLSLYIRFFLGDLRYLDMKYLEKQNADTFMKRYHPFSRMLEFFADILHAVSFYVLAAAITDFHLFYIVIVFLLVLNALWLFITHLTSDRFDSSRTESKSSMIWMINNAATAFVLLICERYFADANQSFLLISFVVIMVINSIVDFFFSRHLYFPKIEEIEE